MVRFLLVLLAAALQLAPQSVGQVRAVLVSGAPRAQEDIPADVVLETGHSKAITGFAFSPDGRYLASASEDRTVILWDPRTESEEARLRGHAAPVRSVAFSPDGTLLASGADDGSVKVWDVEKRSLIRTLSVAKEPVRQLAISGNGRYLIAAAGSVSLWDLSSGAPAAVLKRDASEVTFLFFTIDGHAAIATENGDMEMHGTLETFEVPSGRGARSTEALVRAVSLGGRRMAVQHGQWTTASFAVIEAGRELARFAAPYAPTAFSPDGEWIASTGENGASVVVHRAPAGQPAGIIRGENWGFGGQLAIGGREPLVANIRGDSIQLWNASDGTALHSLGHRPSAAGLAWTRDSKTVITAGSEILYWDIASGKPKSGPALPPITLGLAASPDGNLLAVGGRSVAVVDRRSGTLMRQLSGACDVLPNPAFNPDARLVAANCRGVVTLWDVASGAERMRAGEDNLLDAGFVSFSPDGRFLVASAGPGHVSVYRGYSPAAALDLAVPGGLGAVAFSPDGRLAALGTRSQMRMEAGQLRAVPGNTAAIAVFDLETGRPVFNVPAGDWVSALAFSADGRTLMAAAGPFMQAGKLLALDAASGRVLRTVVEKVDAEGSAAFSPDRAWFAASAGALKLWKVR